MELLQLAVKAISLISEWLVSREKQYANNESIFPENILEEIRDKLSALFDHHDPFLAEMAASAEELLGFLM